jgi:hypothetical protein
MRTSDLRTADVEAKEFALQKLSSLTYQTPNERPIRHHQRNAASQHLSPMVKNGSAR